MAVLNVTLAAALLWCALILGWAARAGLPTRTALDVLEPKNDRDGQ